MATRARTRTRLLDAADELFFTQGIASTPVDAILELAGVSPATMYRAYGSKEGLLAAALERRHEAWLTTWDAAIERADDDQGRLTAVFDALDDFRLRPEGARWCAFLGTAAELVHPPPAVSGALDRETCSLRDRLHALAEPLVGANAGALTDALVLIISGQLAMRLRSEHRPPVEVPRLIAEAMIDRFAPSGPAPGRSA